MQKHHCVEKQQICRKIRTRGHTILKQQHKYTEQINEQLPVKHGRGTRGAALASNAATREGHRCQRVRQRHATCFFFFKLTRADSGQFTLNRTDSGCIGLNRPYQPESAVSVVSAETAETADLGRNSKKKKKKVQNAPFELNIKPHLTQTHQIQLSVSHKHTNTPIY